MFYKSGFFLGLSTGIWGTLAWYNLVNFIVNIVVSNPVAWINLVFVVIGTAGVIFNVRTYKRDVLRAERVR